MINLIDIFPVYGWEKFKPSQKRGDPTKTCTQFSFIDDYLAQRGDFLHHAIDIFCPTGTLVVATVDGIMWPNEELGDTKKEWSFFERGGWHCYLKGDNGYYYYYAHLKTYPLVRPGQRVKKGDIIGIVGISGVVYSCSHLHFAIYRPKRDGNKGRPVNPYSALITAQVLSWNKRRTTALFVIVALTSVTGIVVWKFLK